MSASIEIGGHRIGPGSPTFVIAEVGVNHNGNLELAHRLVDIAAEAGADAVKFQTFTPAALASAEAPQAGYQRTRAPASTQFDMLAELVLDAEAHVALRDHAARAGILFMSSVFDEAAVDLLDRLNVPAIKVPSGEVTNHRLLRRIAATGRPVVMSTGMSHLDEIDAAVRELDQVAERLVLLHCVSSYPADPADCNLRAMTTLRNRYDVPVGWSDHTDGIAVASAAVALGAAIVEKHITLDRAMPGPDHAASIEPPELQAMIAAFRVIEVALGAADKRPTEAELEMAIAARKSLHWRHEVRAGHLVGPDDFIALRPGSGISPARLDELVGSVAIATTTPGEMVKLGDLRSPGRGA